VQERSGFPEVCMNTTMLQTLLNKSSGYVEGRMCFDDDSGTPPGPVRVIAITPEVRRLDEEQRRARSQVAIAWQRPAGARAAVDKPDIVAKMNVSRPKPKPKVAVYRRCPGCNVEMRARQLQLHWPDCPDRVRKRAKKGQPAASSQQPAASSQQCSDEDEPSVKPLADRSWFQESELDELFLGLPVDKKWDAVKDLRKG
jgi:hypothetical protein